MDDSERAQIIAIRSLCDALLISDQERRAREAAAARGVAAACEHLETVDAGSTWTITRRRCVQCDEVIEHDARDGAPDHAGD